MAKVLVIIGVIVSILLIFAFAGVPTTSNLLLGQLGITSSNIDSTNPDAIGSGFQTAVLIILAASVGAGLIAGLILRSSVESSIIATFCGTLMGWIVSDSISIIKFFNNPAVCGAGTGCEWVGNIMLYFMIILIGTSIVSIIAFWRGNDY